MQYLFAFMCVLTLALMGCSETSGTGGNAGDGGSGGTAGTGGAGGMPECQSPEDCDDGNDCTGNACTDGMCEYTPLADGTACDESNECTTGMCANGECDTTPVADGTACGNDAGTCQQGSCQVACTEQGIRDAVAAGGGPYTFDCAGPQTVMTAAEIVIDNDVILDGEGNLKVDGDHENAVISINEGVTAVLTRFMVTGGTCRDFACSPALVRNSGRLALTGSVLSNESGQGGAGLENTTQGTATLTDCSLSSNVGGGIVNFGNLALTDSTVSNNTNWGIESNSGTLTLTSTNVSGNRGEGLRNEGTATLMDCTVTENGGRGIYNAGALAVLGSTVSGNDTGLAGGGIDNDGVLVVANTTVSGNIASRGGGIFNDGSLTLLNSTFVGNTAASGSAISTGPSRPDRDYATVVGGTVIEGNCSNSQPLESSGHNIESPGDTCGFDQATDQVNVTAEELNLGPLQDNGGPTMTHALGAGSVAIDQIPAEDCLDPDGQPLTTDQRGEPRPETGGTMCDVGAFEVQGGDIQCAEDLTECVLGSAPGGCLDGVCRVFDCAGLEDGTPCIWTSLGDEWRPSTCTANACPIP